MIGLFMACSRKNGSWLYSQIISLGILDIKFIVRNVRCWSDKNLSQNKST